MSPRNLLIATVVLVVGLIAWNHFKPVPLVIEEDWMMAAGSASPAPLASAEAQALVDRLAGTEVIDAELAWNEIGARQSSSAAFLATFGPALRDSRPVAFGMAKERFSGDGHTFTSFNAGQPTAKGTPAFVHTVGQALAYHCWQYEDVSNSGFHGNFKAWWTEWAPGKGLPGVQ